ncbi:MAG TPA: phosphoenolpyruvate carboxykinase (ATP), partial [Balneolaceae bacterium]|nr:phosphoenolpyruvate carboxykinase (ATP) [Balneolaceae bacterium]
NTGWTGGEYGDGHRMKLPHTRKMLSEALAGNLDNVSYETDPVFGFEIPTSVDGVPSDVLFPRNTWSDKDSYDAKARTLAQMFITNFEQFQDEASDELMNAAPKAK